MNFYLRSVVLFALSSLFVLPKAASQSATTLAASAPTAVPPLIPYAGSVDGRFGQVSVTFLVYAEEAGGEPLFVETQSIMLDPHGSYKVQLGATLPYGLPVGLFSGGAARWLEVQAAGEPSQPRVLLASVPYALEAANAATLGGLPASAFVLASSVPGASAISSNASTPDAASNVTTTGGTNLYVPKFNGASTIINSEIYDSGTSVGIGGVPNSSVKLDVNGAMIMRGNMQVTRTGNATTSKGFPSYGFQFYSNAYNSSSNANVNPYFQLQSEPTGNDTASPSATFNLLFANGSAVAETGFSINPNGTINFASGQTFPGAGSGTITEVTAGTALTGGGSTGTVTLNVDTTKVPLLTASNTFTGNQTITGTESVSGNISGSADLILPNTASAAVGVVQLGSTPFLSNYGPANSLNAFVGGAGNFSNTGGGNTGVGDLALQKLTSGSQDTAIGLAALNSNTSGTFNTAMGFQALLSNTTGAENTAAGVVALNSNTSGTFNTAVGYQALTSNTTGEYATALGAGAMANSTGSNNTAVGYVALMNNTTGGFNVGIGGGTLGNTTTGGENTAIGYGAGPSSPTLGFTTAIGEGSVVSQTNSLVLGTTYAGTPGKYFNNVGVGTDTPRSVLDLVASELSGLGPVVTLTNSGGGSAAGAAIDFNTYAPSTTGTYNPAARILAYNDNDNDSANIGFLSNKTGAPNQGLQYNMIVFDNGDVNVTGTLSAALKQFKIDHPVDPTNKYLVHASVESSEMMNIYSGNVVTDEQGVATVKLPGWFEAENADFRYQLTVIGTFAQAIIKDKVANGQFRIMTNAANVEVSWQITAVRQDAYAKAHPLVVEQEKSATERGFYAHPEAYSQSFDMRIGSSHAHDQPASAANLHFPQPTPTAIPQPAQGEQRKSVARPRPK